jgi:hypothetical protein
LTAATSPTPPGGEITTTNGEEEDEDDDEDKLRAKVNFDDDGDVELIVKA